MEAADQYYEGYDEGYDEEPQRQPAFMTGGMQHSASIALLTDPKNELRKLELTLRSAYEDSQGNVRQIGKPLMNELGIMSIIGQVHAIVNRTTVMSNLSKHDIEVLMESLFDALAQDLMINTVRYDINSATTRSLIFHMAIEKAYICMKRPFEEGERRFWKGTQQDIRMVSENTMPGRDIISRITGWGQKK